MKDKYKNILYMALMAATVTTLCDKVHILTGTLSYPNPHWDGQPLWVFPGFLVTFMVMGIAYMQLVQLLPASMDRTFSTSKADFRAMTESILLFAFVYLLSGFGNKWPLLLNALFYGSIALRLLASPDKGFMLILSVILGIGGMVGEGLMSAFDLVHYAREVVFYVPVWLGGVYMHGAFALRDSMRFFVYGSE